MKIVILLVQLILPLMAYAVPAPFYTVIENGSNEMMMLDSGTSALEIRLDMIRRAKRTIDVEYFCYNTDLASKIFSLELIAAAKRGVKVRLLVDKAPNVFVFTEEYAKVLVENGIDFRYFNNASLINITQVIYRNHRKLLAIDGKEAITGGRNIGDEYFDLATTLSYSDRDIYVRGSIVASMVETFNKFYEYEMSERPDFKKISDIRHEVKKFYSFTPKELELKNRIALLGKQELSKIKLHKCPTTTFASDAPGGGFWGIFSHDYADRYRFLRKILIEKISHVDRNLLISTPYFLTNADSRDLFVKLLKEKVPVTIFTNSLTSSDATYMSAIMYFWLRSWTNLGMRFYFHDGKWPGESELASINIKNSLWSDHSKTHVYETKAYSEIMIGTFNMHNRSSYYDSEMAIFCKGNDELTQEVKASVMKRALKGIRIDRNLKAYDSKGSSVSKYGSSRDKVQEMKFLTFPVWFIKFLL